MPEPYRLTICIHITTYLDEVALRRALLAVYAQLRSPSFVHITDNSPERLCLQPSLSPVPVEHDHQPSNLGTAGAINKTIRRCLKDHIDYLWILDQDSEPKAELLAGLIEAHRSLCASHLRPIGIVAPLTRNRDDGQPNAPLRFERYRTRKVAFKADPLECDFLPASGMLLHLPSLRNLILPPDRYFLDIYDFALGLAAQRAGAGIWLFPRLNYPIK
jgi:rhamnosyltransferase